MLNVVSFPLLLIELDRDPILSKQKQESGILRKQNEEVMRVRRNTSQRTWTSCLQKINQPQPRLNPRTLGIEARYPDIILKIYQIVVYYKAIKIIKKNDRMLSLFHLY